ncbi:unnamed protein product [Fusarium graminearum]|nr:unnamed protein product [Fusarium graminearum]
MDQYARDTTDAVDEESRSVAIYFDKLLSEWFLTVSFGPLRTIPAVDFWRMENGEWRMEKGTSFQHSHSLYGV